MSNILALTAQDTGNVWPLRGDMGVALDFTPDEFFSATFTTYTADLFVFTSTTAQFRQLDGSMQPTLTVGGQIAQFIKLKYNKDDVSWDVVAHNRNTSSSGPEVVIAPDESNIITLDRSLGTKFATTLVANSVLANPIGFAPGDEIDLIVRQDAAGGHNLAYGLNYALPAAQPPKLSQGSGVIDKFKIYLTTQGEYILTPYVNAYGLVTGLALIGQTVYYKLAGADQMGAFNQLQPGQTVYIVRNGTSAEATGSIVGTDLSQVFRIHGVAVPTNSGDPRPLLKMLKVDYGEGPPRGANRPAYGKAILNFEGKGTVYVRDLRITGARNYTNNAHGMCNNADGMSLIIQNVEITDCNNGVLNGNTGMTGNTELYDVLIDYCGIGGDDPENSHGTYSSAGFTHSMYMGHNNATIKLERVTMSNAVDGDNLKCRTGTVLAKQVRCIGATAGRELEIPNGAWLEMENCEFIKPETSNNGSLVIVGGNGGAPNTPEGCDLTRPRKYKFTNCLFRSDYVVGGGKDGYLVCSLDPEVPLEFIDCAFEGSAATNNGDDPNNQPTYAGTVTVNGIRYFPNVPPIFTYTGGPVGPILPVGYQPIPMTVDS